MGINFRALRTAQSHPAQDEAAVGPQGAGDAMNAPALTKLPPCPYCGSREVSEANETGRGHQYVCKACGGAQSTSGDNVASPELIGDPSNHPRDTPDPDTGGVGGAGNLPQSPKVIYDRPGERRMNSWEAALRTGAIQHLAERPHDAIPVKHAGFAGFVDAYHGAHEDIKDMERQVDGMGSHPVNSFDEHLWEQNAPKPQSHHLRHMEEHGDFPESYHERHEDAYGRAKEQRDEDEQPMGHHTPLTNFILNHNTNHELWKSHGSVEHVDLKSQPIHACQPFVLKNHLDRYHHNPDDVVNHVHQTGLGDHNRDYPGTHMPMMVRHEGNMFAIEGHHRTGAALMRGDSHIKAAVYDADKHGWPENHEDEGYHAEQSGFHRYAEMMRNHPDRDCDYTEVANYGLHMLHNHDDGICVATELRRRRPGGISARGSLDSELSFHFCATWADVRNKAREITRSGGVRIAVASAEGLGGEVQGERNVYETMLNYVPGTKKIAYWHCGCKWASYAWGRSAPYRRFEGRMCAHALAMQFEAQRQHAFDRKPHAEEHTERPDWLRSDTRVVVHHQRGTEREPARDHARMGSRFGEEFADRVMSLYDHLASQHDPEGIYPSGHALDLVNTPLHAVASVMAVGGEPPGSIMRTLLAYGAAHEPAQHLVRTALDQAPHEHPEDYDPGDARQHAMDFGAGVPADGRSSKVGWCDQCQGAGCGACGGTGQMIDGKTPIPDQNVDAGERSRGKQSLEASLRTADYASGDPFPYSAPESGAGGNHPDHSFSKNPGSTGYATSQDPQNWADAWDQRDSMGGQHFSVREHPADRGLGNAEFRGGHPLWNGARAGSNGSDVGGRQLRERAASVDPVLDVLGLGTGQQMPEVLAGRVVAGVPGSGAGVSDEALERPPMGSHHAGAAGGGVGAVPEHARSAGAEQAARPGVAGIWARAAVDEGFVAGLDVDGDPTSADPRALRHDAKGSKKSDSDLDPPTHAGVALKAHDTGRVLMLQRALGDPKDPAAGKWEFPGGALDKGDHTTLHGAIREFEEEVGQPFPAGGTVHHTWRSGPYQGHLVLIPYERGVDPRAPRTVENPDDDNEAVAWQEPRGMRWHQHTRDEVKSGTPWKRLENASLSKAAELNEEPEPALPTTTGAEDDEANWGPPQDAKGHIPVGGNGSGRPGERYRSQMTPGIGGDESVNPSSGSDHITPKASVGSVDAIVAQFQATAGAKALQAASGPSRTPSGPAGREGAGRSISDSDIALAAKTALKNFTPTEQAELISEGTREKVRARNFSDLRIEGTHYEELDVDSDELVI